MQFLHAPKIEHKTIRTRKHFCLIPRKIGVRISRPETKELVDVYITYWLETIKIDEKYVNSYWEICTVNNLKVIQHPLGL